jgi:hypothetical protein
MEGNQILEELLVSEPTAEPIASVDALLDQCLRALTTRLWQACCWSDSQHIGNFRFVVVEFEPAPNVSLYVQFWSEPLEPALMEVCSGHWNPGALRYVWHDQRLLLEQRGFTVGGPALNFQKHVAIESPDDAERAARDTLAILFDVFGYHGQHPLTVKLHADSRSETRPVFTALTRDDFVKMALQGGFQVSGFADHDGLPVVGLKRGRFRGTATLGSDIGGGSRFASVLLRASVRDRAPRLPKRLRTDLAPLVPMSFAGDADGRLQAETSLVLDGGVTADWIVAALDRWRAAVHKCRRALDLPPPKPTARRLPPAQGRLSIQ